MQTSTAVRMLLDLVRADMHSSVHSHICEQMLP